MDEIEIIQRLTDVDNNVWEPGIIDTKLVWREV